MTRNKTPYPLILLFIICSFIGFLAWSAHRASTGGTEITDRDYYSKGLKYNSTLVEKRAASVLGWQVRTFIDGHRLDILLTDAQKDPVTGATGLLIHLPGAETYELEEVDPGFYRVDIPQFFQNETHFRLEFDRQGARIFHRLLLNLPGKHVKSSS